MSDFRGGSEMQDFGLKGPDFSSNFRFSGPGAALPRNFKSVGNMARRDASSESNSIGVSG